MPAVTGLPSESGTTSFETSNSLSGHFGDRQVRWTLDPDLTTNIWLPIWMWARRVPSGGSDSVNRATGDPEAPGVVGQARNWVYGESQPVDS